MTLPEDERKYHAGGTDAYLMAKLNDNCIFISAREKTNIDQFRDLLYKKVKELHVQKYPYNDFLYQTYDEE